MNDKQRSIESGNRIGQALVGTMAGVGLIVALLMGPCFWPVEMYRDVSVDSQPGRLSPPTCPATVPRANDCVRRAGNVLTVVPGADLQHVMALTRPGDVVQFTAGTFLVDPKVSLVPADNVTVQGIGPATVLRVRDSVGDFSGLFGGQDACLRGFVLRYMTIDVNPGGYGGRPSSRYPACAVLAWRLDGVTVDHVDVTYGGACGIDLNGPARVGRNATVTHCNLRFVPVGPTWYDNAGVYVECYNAEVSWNTFVSATNDPSSAIELHGGPARAVGNRISGYLVAINVVSAANHDADSPSGRMVIQSNVIQDAAYGVLLWASAGDTLAEVTVADNDIAISKRWKCFWTAGVSPNHGGPEVSGTYDRVTVTGNTVRFEAGDSRRLDRRYSGGVNANTTGLATRWQVFGNETVNLPSALAP